MQNEKNIIFTDGASRGNPGPGGWAAIVVQGEGVAEYAGAESLTTNNRMELSAAIEALCHINQGATVTLYTDSRYVINGITKWVYGWQSKGWVTAQKDEVQNKDLWQKLIKAVEGKKVEWAYVGGHVGIPGNERADEIATCYADQRAPDLFKGSLKEYPVNILKITGDESKKSDRDKSRTRSNAKAFSYVSEVNGEVKVHATWGECEARVKGKRARFKKALSKEDELVLVKEWSR